MDDDAALVSRARTGDREALAAIYDRYADRLHDFCFSILRDRQEAADAFHDAFVAAAQRLDQLRDPSRLRPWLFAIARHEAFRRARARSRQVPTEEFEDMKAEGADEGRAVDQGEAARLVWAAAAGLSERDRALLDLNVRHGLDGQELADAVGVDVSHAYVLLSRLRDQVERSLGALLVARYARKDCPDLTKLLAGWDGRFSPLIRKRVARHADSCEVCEDRRRALASPLALLAAMPLVACPDGLRDRILGDARLVASDRPRPDQAWDEFPPSMYPSGPGARRAVMAVAAAVVVVAALGLVLLLGGTDDEPETVPVAAGPPLAVPTTAATTTTVGETPLPTTSTPPTTAPPVPPAPPAPAVPPTGPQLRLGTSALAFGPTSTEQPLTVANDGGAPLGWSATVAGPFTVVPAGGTLAPGASLQVAVRFDRASAAEGRVAGTVSITSDGGSGSVDVSAVVLRPPLVRASADVDRLARTACTATGRTIASITAEVTDESAIRSVVLRWRDPAGVAGSSELGGSGGATYQGRLGPFAGQGTVTWWVEATDAAGATGRSPERTLPVDTCRAAG
ncbi:MAG: sigma-70 family RNA polymerase sigma factor [Acidimicrobiia bacterium]